ncbi:MAG TPA: TetR/AcrR family transcriptional regulator, partial [Ktedonobacteraceae bacterium]|nr:TetR/AcrR family transcriptional regulator [Ktedonobacteraceae bacterium]
RGYTNTTLEAIADAADIGVGTVYSYFSGKDELFLAIIERGLDLLESYLDEAFDPTRTPRQQLIASGESYFRFASDHPRHFRLLNLKEQEIAPGKADSPVARRKAQIDARVSRLIERNARAIRQIIGDAHPALLDADQIARFDWGAWNGVITLYLQDNAHRFDAVSAEAALAQGRRLLIAGVEALLAGNATHEW